MRPSMAEEAGAREIPMVSIRFLGFSKDKAKSTHIDSSQHSG